MMTTEAPMEVGSPCEISAGRLVVQYLQQNKDGATATEIMKHLRGEMKTDLGDLDKVVESVLENGTALGFLERKGSHYMNWVARQMCGRRRRRSRSRRRRIRRRRSCRRRRRRRRRC